MYCIFGKKSRKIGCDFNFIVTFTLESILRNVDKQRESDEVVIISSKKLFSGRVPSLLVFSRNRFIENITPKLTKNQIFLMLVSIYGSVIWNLPSIRRKTPFTFRYFMHLFMIDFKKKVKAKYCSSQLKTISC